MLTFWVTVFVMSVALISARLAAGIDAPVAYRDVAFAIVALLASIIGIQYELTPPVLQPQGTHSAVADPDPYTSTP